MNVPYHPPHRVDHLRNQCRQTATREFRARGISVNRCPQCLLGSKTCICDWRPSIDAEVDFVLLMHRNEVYKPTNTGRLIADVMPHNCYAFLYHRTEPDPALIGLLQDPSRQCQLLFPSEHPTPATTTSPSSEPSQRLTLILLDGTWKQASRMATQAKWLQHLPRYTLSTTAAGLQQYSQYQLRKADHEERLSTAQAAALCLKNEHYEQQAEILLAYFDVFNEHYVSTRLNRQPQHNIGHQLLESFKR